ADLKSRPKRDPYFIKLIGRALSALETLRHSPDALSLNEAAARLGGAKSSVFRILYTLEVLGYLEKDSAGRYLLSERNRSEQRAPFLGRVMRSAMARMKEISRELQETVSLAALFDNHIEV